MKWVTRYNEDKNITIILHYQYLGKNNTNMELQVYELIFNQYNTLNGK